MRLWNQKCGFRNLLVITEYARGFYLIEIMIVCAAANLLFKEDHVFN